MNLFYCQNIGPGIFTLDEEESRHCLKVLRQKKGEVIFVTDGKGSLAECEIIDENVKGCSLKVLNIKEDFGERNFRLHIAIAPTKNINRFEWFLEKSAEIGIDEITPVICEHSERKTINIERLNKILISSLKQSNTAYLPVLNPIINFNTFIQHSTFNIQNYEKYIAICDENISKKHLKDVYHKGNDTIILIGPEGDFSPEEANAAIEKGFSPVTLSNNRLRIETAAILACGIINTINT